MIDRETCINLLRTAQAVNRADFARNLATEGGAENVFARLNSPVSVVCQPHPCGHRFRLRGGDRHGLDPVLAKLVLFRTDEVARKGIGPGRFVMPEGRSLERFEARVLVVVPGKPRPDAAVGGTAVPHDSAQGRAHQRFEAKIVQRDRGVAGVGDL